MPRVDEVTIIVRVNAGAHRIDSAPELALVTHFIRALEPAARAACATIVADQARAWLAAASDLSPPRDAAEALLLSEHYDEIYVDALERTHDASSAEVTLPFGVARACAALALLDRTDVDALLDAAYELGFASPHARQRLERALIEQLSR